MEPIKLNKKEAAIAILACLAFFAVMIIWR